MSEFRPIHKIASMPQGRRKSPTTACGLRTADHAPDELPIRLTWQWKRVTCANCLRAKMRKGKK